MILFVDAIPDQRRIPYTLKRAAMLKKALGGDFTHAVLGHELGSSARETVAKILWSVLKIRKEMRRLGKGDAIILAGGGVGRLLFENGAGVPNCLRITYAHDDPSYRSVKDNSFTVERYKPHILFAKQVSRLEWYKARVSCAEWVCYGVDIDVFHPMPDVPVTYRVAIGSGKTKLYKVRFEWMEKLGRKLGAKIASGLSYADYAKLLASAEIAVDIPNTRQMGHKEDWRLSVNYRSFEGLAMGKPVLVPDLPGYRRVFARDRLTLFYRPDYSSFEKKVREALALPDLQEYAERGLAAVRSRFSLAAVTKREAEIIRRKL